MLGFLSKLLGGNKSEKDVTKLQPLVTQINEFYTQYQNLSNDELRSKTTDFRSRIADHLKASDDEITDLKQQAEKLEENDIQNKDAIYKDIDTIKKERDKKIEEILTEILPEGFAVVK